jgi:uroporphyrinogen-III synthase
VAGARVLLPRADIGREAIGTHLRAAGAMVTEVIAYRTVTGEPGPDAPDVTALLAAGEIDAVTFTSGSAVRSFVGIYGEASTALLKRTVVAVIGPVTADAARDLGVRVDVQPQTYTTTAMVDALADHWR